MTDEQTLAHLQFTEETMQEVDYALALLEEMVPPSDIPFEDDPVAILKAGNERIRDMLGVVLAGFEQMAKERDKALRDLSDIEDDIQGRHLVHPLVEDLVEELRENEWGIWDENFIDQLSEMGDIDLSKASEFLQAVYDHEIYFEDVQAVIRRLAEVFGVIPEMER